MAKYIVGKSAIHGTGLFAYQSLIEMGEKILVEGPMLQIAAPNDGDASIKAACNRLFDEMSKLRKSEATTLHLVAKKNGFGNDIAPNDFVTGLHNQYEDALVVAMEAFCKAWVHGDNATRRVFKTFYQLNHSCSPNTERYWNEADQTMDLRATRNIQPGNEIFISYIDHFNARDKRRSALGFDCKCLVCSYDGSKRLIHEQRLEVLRRSLAVVHQFSSQYLLG